MMMNPATIHLCVTHSALVTRVFEATMAMNDVPPDRVRWLSRRHAPFSGTGLSIDSLSDEMEKSFKAGDHATFRNLSARLDGILSELSGSRPFVAYVPHLNKVIYQEIILHPACEGYGFLEEGFTAMSWRGRKNARTSWFKILRSSLRSRRVGARYRFTRLMFDHSLPHYRAAFAISSRAFDGMPGRVDVAPHLPALPAGGPTGKVLVVLDAIYLFQGIHWRDYENALADSLRTLPQPVGEVLVKFHFADPEPDRKFESLRQLLSETGGPSMRLVGPDFVVEDHLGSGDLLVFAVTALGYYAALSGCRVRCFAEAIHGFDLDALMAAGKIPADFRRVAGLPDPGKRP